MITSEPFPSPSSRLQALICAVLGTPAEWGRQAFQPAPFLSTLRGHKPQIVGFPLLEGVERCAGCNHPHAPICEGLRYCEPCGEAWCSGCLSNDDVGRGSCPGCCDLLCPPASTCGLACAVAAEAMKKRYPCVSNIVLSWGSLVVTTGNDRAISSTDVSPDTWWGCGNLLPTKLVCTRRFWATKRRDPSSRITICMTVTTEGALDAPLVLVSEGSQDVRFGPDDPGLSSRLGRSFLRHP